MNSSLHFQKYQNTSQGIKLCHLYYMYMQKYYNEERTHLLNSLSLSLSSIHVDFDIADNLSVGSKIKINVQT